MNDIVKKKPDSYARSVRGRPLRGVCQRERPRHRRPPAHLQEGRLGLSARTAPPSRPRLASSFIVPETMRGWMKWRDSRVVASDMGLVRDNFLVKHRYALDDLEESTWETNPDGTLRDPWAKTYRALLIECSPPHGDVTFSGSSYGLELALKEICRVYSAENELHPDAYPVVGLRPRHGQTRTGDLSRVRGSTCTAGRPSRTLGQAVRRRQLSPSLRRR